LRPGSVPALDGGNTVLNSTACRCGSGPNEPLCAEALGSWSSWGISLAPSQAVIDDRIRWPQASPEYPIAMESCSSMMLRGRS